MKERSLKLDNVKGILITLVVIGHMLLPIQGTTRAVTNFFFCIYAFHMPAFVFLSGLLSQNIYIRPPEEKPDEGRRRMRSRRRRETKRTVRMPQTPGGFRWRRWRGMLLLYLLFQLVLFFTEIPAYGRTTRFPDFLHTSGAPWYLLALLLWYLLIPFFDFYKGRQLPGGIPYAVPVLLLLIVMSLAGGYLDGLGDFLALDRVIAFAPFFFAGFFLGPERLLRFLKDHAVGRSVLIFLGMLCFLFIGTQCYDHLLPYQKVVYGAWYIRFHPEQHPEAFPGLLCECLWLIRLLWFLIAGWMSLALLALVPDRRIPFLTNAGQRTLQIYLLHRPIRDLLLASGFITAPGPENHLHVLFLILLSICITQLLSVWELRFLRRIL